MQLEQVTLNEGASGSGVPLLFVHGVSHGAWCWEPWLEWFAARGREVHAISLRGHAGSEGRDRLDEFGLADYRDDVLATAGRLRRRPVVIGHSMGGAIVQLAMAHEPQGFAAGVLLAPLPHNSMRPLDMLRLVLRGASTAAMRKLSAGGRPSPEEIRKGPFFSKRITLDDAARYTPLLQPESRKAQSDLIAFNVPPLTCTEPLLVLGSAGDDLFGRGALKRTARHHKADLIVMEKACHDIMLDPLRDEGAALLLGWLEAKGL